MEWVAAFAWNGWQASSGISGSFGLEYAGTTHSRRNQRSDRANCCPSRPRPNRTFEVRTASRLQSRVELDFALHRPQESGRLARRIAALEQQLCALKAMRSNDARHRFGDRSERLARAAAPRRRGQQPGCPGPGRTPRAALEARPEIRELPTAERSCRQCGQPYAAHGFIESELIEIQVVAHTRRLRRQRYRKVCGCAGPATVAAPPVPRLFPHTAYGISVWATLLLERFAGQRPFRQIARWMTCHGLPISPGTLCDRLGDLASLFEPLSQAIRAHLVTARVLQGDETSWRVQDSRRDGGGGAPGCGWVRAGTPSGSTSTRSAAERRL